MESSKSLRFLNLSKAPVRVRWQSHCRFSYRQKDWNPEFAANMWHLVSDVDCDTYSCEHHAFSWSTYTCSYRIPAAWRSVTVIWQNLISNVVTELPSHLYFPRHSAFWSLQSVGLDLLLVNRSLVTQVNVPIKSTINRPIAMYTSHTNGQRSPDDMHRSCETEW